MGVVWITCPTTGRRFPTGIETDQPTLDAVPAWTAKYTCPACHRVHKWADVQPELIDEPRPMIHDTWKPKMYEEQANTIIRLTRAIVALTVVMLFGLGAQIGLALWLPPHT